MRLLVALVLLLIPVSTFADDIIYACINPGNSGVRIVDAATACRPNEARVQWNATGPQGPPGPPGPQGPPGPAGTDGGGGAPYVWVCGPLNYGNASNTAAVLHIFNAGSVPANVSFKFLNKDGLNLTGAAVPLASPLNPGDPIPTFPGHTGSATTTVQPDHTLVQPWLSAFGVAANGGNMPASLKVTSDQPVDVGAHIAFNGYTVVPCNLAHR